ncbi:MAG: hypothetical protein ABIJ14_03715 [Nanoarchaeota archaeon]|nr:hypothetical protein [Nanoarchaeota archaeon]
MFKKRKGQIWIETVIYTLIAFTMIGLVLTFVKPEIEKLQDQAIIEQSIEVLEEINNIFKEINIAGTGNQRLIELGIKKGVLKIDGADDKLIFEIESLYEYSEPKVNYTKRDLVAYTEKKGKFNLITFTRDYDEEYDIKFNDEDLLKTITKSPSPYKLLISHKGKIANKTIINLGVN